MVARPRSALLLPSAPAPARSCCVRSPPSSPHELGLLLRRPRTERCAAASCASPCAAAPAPSPAAPLPATAAPPPATPPPHLPPLPPCQAEPARALEDKKLAGGSGSKSAQTDRAAKIAAIKKQVEISGDVEQLLLKDEKWEFIAEEQSNNPDAASDMSNM